MRTIHLTPSNPNYAALLDSSVAFADVIDGRGHAVVDVELTVEGAANVDEAYLLASSALRGAIHSVGGHTPGWDERANGIIYRITEEAVEILPV